MQIIHGLQIDGKPVTKTIEAMMSADEDAYLTVMRNPKIGFYFSQLVNKALAYEALALDNDLLDNEE